MSALTSHVSHLSAAAAGVRDVNCAPGRAKTYEVAIPSHDRQGVVCCRAEWDGGWPPDPDFVERVLSPWEQESWIAMRAVEKRRREWLLGRAVAKDVVCRLIARQAGRRLAPAEVEIVPDAFGCPRAMGAWAKPLGVAPVISIAHSEGTAVALAVLDPGWLAGIDLESIDRRRENFEAVAFSDQERGLLRRVPEDLRQEWALRMWCAKEAVGKALGRGLSAGLQAFRIPELEISTGKVPVEWQGATLVAYTIREAGFVLATTICRRGAV